MADVTCGVYTITGPRGTTYVGSSDDIARRWKTHRSQLRGSRHHNYLLQAAWNEHGEAAFTFTVIEAVPVADLIEAEQRHLNAAIAAGLTYNLCRDVSSPGRGNLHTAEAKLKMSVAIKASMTPAALDAKSQRIKGSRNPASKLTEDMVREICGMLLAGTHPGELASDLGLSEGTIYQIRRGQIWKHIVTPEIAAAMKAVRQNPWASGKRTVTDEHRERFAGVGRARKGAVLSPEHLAQMSAASTGAGNGNATLTAEDVLEIKRRLAAGARNMDLAPEFGVSVNTISRIRNGTSWGHVVLPGAVIPAPAPAADDQPSLFT
jgi:DNA-binding CsgD family transcriptional regulator